MLKCGSMLLEHLKSSKEHGAFVQVWVDSIRRVYSTAGYVAGARVWKAMAQRILGCLPSTSYLGHLHFGFVVHAWGFSSEHDVDALAEALLGAFDRPFLVQGRSYYLDCAIGYVHVSPTKAQEVGIETITELAAAASEQARNQPLPMQRFEPHLRDVFLEKEQLLTGLHEAVDQGRLHLVYQPRIHLETGRVVGAEALLRSTSPELAAVPTTRLIEIAEESSLIFDITEVTLSAVAKAASAYAVTLPPDFRWSVNISQRWFEPSMGTDLVTLTESSLAETGARANMLEYEVTETAYIQRNARGPFIESLDAVRALGISISIDDFCAGYGAVNLLATVRADILKLDGALVRDAATNHRTHRLMSAIARIGSDLGLALVAEGIETEGQLDATTRVGATYGQGHYLSRPLPLRDLLALARSASVGAQVPL